MNPKNNLKELAISETGFVFDPFSGATFTVNTSGLCVLQAAREGLDRDGIGERVTARFTALREEVERDLSDFATLLAQQGIVPADFAF